MITVWNTPIAASVEQILRDLKLMLFAEGLLRDQNNTGSGIAPIGHTVTVVTVKEVPITVTVNIVYKEG